LQLHSERESSDDGDRGCSTSAHVSDSMPAICRASNLVVLFLVRQLQLVQDLKATRLVADCFEHHFEKSGRMYMYLLTSNDSQALPTLRIIVNNQLAFLRLLRCGPLVDRFVSGFW
jgi:hypothetical protein